MMLRAGQYDVYILETGRFRLDAGVVFGVIPKALWGKNVTPDSQNRMKMALRSILIIGNDHKILVETGAGRHLNKRLKRLYQIDHSEFSLEKALKQVGISKDEITDVINTHLHFDHCGGNVVFQEGALSPAFPNAIYHIQKAQLKWAQSPSILDKNSYVPEDYMLLLDQNMIRSVEGETELFPGIHIFTTRGHTPGQQHILLKDFQEPLFFCADLFPLHYNIKTTWISSLDIFPLDFIAEKEKFLYRAEQNAWRIIFPHDKEVISAKVRKSTKYYRAYEKRFDY
ncbi:MAG: MBL fold metallo-hydrolase [Candidatus Marinimicrobia bacterium]|nr:MBL fold metallo-hydrolase [Candidatus Neomarinimicrobiota bacterium]